jgi:hypothetical protein
MSKVIDMIVHHLAFPFTGQVPGNNVDQLVITAIVHTSFIITITQQSKFSL